MEIWWWQTSWWYPTWMDVQWGDGHLNIGHPEVPAGEWDYRGSGGFGSGDAFSWTEYRYRFRILAQYVLNRDRMPAHPTLVTSTPRLVMSGGIRARSGEAALFDDPSISATLRLRQEVHSEGRVPLAAEDTHRLVRISDRAGAEEVRWFNPATPLLFPALTPWLDGRSDLIVKLEVELSMSREGTGRFRFLPTDGEEHFWIDLPQWDLPEVNLI